MIRKLHSTTARHPGEKAAKRFIAEGPGTRQESRQAQRERVSYERVPQSPVSPGDERLKEEIRKAVAADDSIAAAGEYIDIIVSHGMVTLRGEVSSDDEKIAIGDKAVACAGFGKVINQLYVSGGEGVE